MEKLISDFSIGLFFWQTLLFIVLILLSSFSSLFCIMLCKCYAGGSSSSSFEFDIAARFSMLIFSSSSSSPELPAGLGDNPSYAPKLA